jgi:lambda family phage tail tape measure protein
MANKSVADFLVDLKIDGIEGVNQLKGSLRSLSRAAGPTDKGLKDIARAVKNFNRAGGESRQVIQGQIDALKGLKSQATLGGQAFRQLSKDVAEYEAKLKSVDAQIDSTGRKIKSLRQVETQFTKRSIEGLENQIDSRTKLLEKEIPLTAAYAQQLGGILAIEEAITQAKQRQAVAAAAQKQAAFRFGGFTPGLGQDVSGGPADIRSAFAPNLPELPNTLSAINLELGEQRSKLQDLDVTSDEYTKTQQAILDLEKRLKAATEGRTQAVIDQEQRLKALDEQEIRRARRAAKVAGIQEALSGRRGDTLEIGSRDPRTGAIIAEGTAPLRPQVPTQVREVSGLYRSISDIGMSGINADIDRMGKSVEMVTRDIKAATAASNGSISALQNQRAAFASLRAGIDPTSKEFRKLSREIERVDRRLEKLSKRRGSSLRNITATLGGVAAGGIFGGPEGAVGGAIGGIFGGGPGAATGAAIGAQAGMLRQNIEGFAEYAANVDKALIALKGIAGSQENYNVLLAQATKVTEQLNVPQEVAIRGITRLSAAVLGANGNVNDAARAFTQIIIAVKGTAGGAEDVNSALTALVQIFSKGKVSAEELSGQLGERFPAAVTEFAKANKMTTMELQAALKDGTVGLGELMKFLAGVGEKYQGIALEIAQSNEEAGARSQVAFNEMRLAIGRAITPIGAELQTAIANFVKNNITAITNFAQAFADFVKKVLDGIAFLIKHGDKIKDLIAIIVGGAVGGKLLGLIINVGVKIVPLIKRVGLLRTAILLLNRTMMINPFFLLAAGITAAGVAIGNYVNRHDKVVQKINSGALSIAESEKAVAGFRQELKELQEQDDINTGLTGVVTPANKSGLPRITGADLRPSRQQPAITKQRIKELRAYIAAGEAAIENRKELEKPLSGLLEGLGEGVDFGKLLPTGAGDEKKDMSPLELELRKRILDAQYEGNDVLTARLQMISRIMLADEQFANGQIKANERQNEQYEGTVEYLTTIRELAKERKEQQEQAFRQLQDARFEGTLVSEQERQRVEIQRQLKDFAKAYKDFMTDEQLQAALAELQKHLENANKPLFKFKKGLREVFDEAMNVAEAVGEVGVNAVKDLGDAFADFVTTGKANFRDFANSVISDLARIFAKKALFQGLSLIPGVGNFLGLGGGGGGGGGGTAEDSFAGVPNSILDDILKNANGNVIARNKIVPYAMGGIVNKPTFFQYANGGSGRFGLMGEAGPEAIMPLRRGANGKLGVEASGGAMGNITVNVDAAGSTVEGDTGQANQLGKAIGIAVQQELIKQKRPGGLLAS